jgi:hypothetical protein
MFGGGGYNGGYPGFNVFAGADLTGSLNLNTTQPSSALMTQGPSAALYGKMPYGSVFWDQWVKHFITKNPAFDSTTLDPQRTRAPISSGSAICSASRTSPARTSPPSRAEAASCS